MIGISKSVSIYDVKVLDDNLKGDIDNIIKGITWSIKNDVNIIHMSFGFQRYNKELHDAIKNAKNKGIILVAAAGITWMIIVTIQHVLTKYILSQQ